MAVSLHYPSLSLLSFLRPHFGGHLICSLGVGSPWYRSCFRRGLSVVCVGANGIPHKITTNSSSRVFLRPLPLHLKCCPSTRQGAWEAYNLFSLCLVGSSRPVFGWPWPRWQQPLQALAHSLVGCCVTQRPPISVRVRAKYNYNTRKWREIFWQVHASSAN